MPFISLIQYIFSVYMCQITRQSIGSSKMTIKLLSKTRYCGWVHVLIIIMIMVEASIVSKLSSLMINGRTRIMRLSSLMINGRTRIMGLSSLMIRGGSQHHGG